MSHRIRIIAGFFLLPTFIASFLTSTVQAVPDIIFYSTNIITHYDPTACNPQSGGEGGENSGSGGDANVKTVLEYFTGKGLTLAQAAGIAGNMKQESGFDPRIIQGGATAPDNYDPVDGVGFGLVQWTFDSRQKPLEKLAKDTGRKITDMTLQLDNVWRELNGGYKKTLQALIKTNDPVEAAVIVHGPPYPGYEASADSPKFVRDVRGGNAQGYYDKFRSEIKDGTGVNIDGEVQTPTASSGGAGGACGKGAASDFSADGFVVYDQCDPRWASVAYGTTGKTACTSGCGPTAMAMAITALTGKSVTPKETVAYASSKGMYENGVGSKWTLPTVIGDHWNVTAKRIEMTESSISKVLNEGGLVILSGGNATPFTSAGHYILIRGVTSDGKWKIGDSNGEKGKANSQKEWSPKEILVNANAGSTYAVTK